MFFSSFWSERASEQHTRNTVLATAKRPAAEDAPEARGGWALGAHGCWHCVRVRDPILRLYLRDELVRDLGVGGLVLLLHLLAHLQAEVTQPALGVLRPDAPALCAAGDGRRTTGGQVRNDER